MALPEHIQWSATATTAAATTFTGPGGGMLPADVDFATVTAGGAGRFIVLNTNFPVGGVIRIWVGANGFKLQTLSGSSQTINNVDCSGAAAATIGANTYSTVKRASSTAWLLMNESNLGAVNTAIVPA